MSGFEIGLLIFVILLLLFIVLMSRKIAHNVYHPLRWSIEETRVKENERTPDLMAAYDSWEKTSYELHSRFGYDLKVHFVPFMNPDGTLSKKFVVIAHGYTYTHHGSIKYADIMRKLGFSVVMFDERFHGESGGKNCSLGFYEQYDLEDLISDTFRRYGNDLFLGTYGESMGATTALLEQAFDKRLKFVIADCAFADMSMLVTYLIKRKAHLPKYPFLPLSNLFFKAATGASMQAVEPRVAILKATQPVMFLHGSDDAFVPCIHSQILYDLCPTAKALYLAPNNARHAESFRKNREEYTRLVTEFLTENVLNKA